MRFRNYLKHDLSHICPLQIRLKDRIKCPVGNKKLSVLFQHSGRLDLSIIFLQAVSSSFPSSKNHEKRFRTSL